MKSAIVFSLMIDGSARSRPSSAALEENKGGRTVLNPDERVIGLALCIVTTAREAAQRDIGCRRLQRRSRGRISPRGFPAMRMTASPRPDLFFLGNRDV